jgi:GntR family transcriptional regulator
MLAVRITPGSSSPIFQQIVTQIRHAIATGGLAESEFLPSVRHLAEQLLINPNTVAKAYADLSKDGLITALPGKGLAVAARRPGMGLTKAERLRRMEPAVSQLLHEAIALGLGPQDIQEIVEKRYEVLAGAKNERTPTGSHAG